MHEAAQVLVGKHDFRSFVTGDIGRKRTIRDVYKAEINQDGEMIIFDMVANSFLPHQVRNTIGALIKVGQGSMTVDDFYNILERRTEGLAGPTAPASGLCLMRVNYPAPFEGDAQ